MEQPIVHEIDDSPTVPGELGLDTPLLPVEVQPIPPDDSQPLFPPEDSQVPEERSDMSEPSRPDESASIPPATSDDYENAFPDTQVV